MDSLLPIKAGDSLDLDYALPIELGENVATVTSHVRTKKHVLVAELTVTAGDVDSDAAHWRLYAGPDETADWPLTTLYCDVKNVTDDDEVVHTDTFLVPVIRAQTP